MAYTSNYHLYITDDSSERFVDWRTKLNGVTDSNMTIIDAALGDKADHSTQTNLTLSANSWTGNSAPYTQTLSITGLTATQNGLLGLATSATAAQREAARSAMMSVGTQSAGSLTVIADGACPEIDIPVTLTLLN